ncbi:MAG: hypothetical protein K6T57_13955 [Thermaceae bacterium]|nr:hypothetical protein [Thermaceae bacterium]
MSKLCRREVLALVLALTSLALAQGGQGGQGNQGREGEERAHTLYAQVNLAKDGVVGLSAGRLETASPWAKYLAPGMWVRAWGEWEDGVFYAQRLEVAQPGFFSYYKGPAAPLGLGGGWVEAWHTSDGAGGAVRRLAVQSVTPGGEVILLVRRISGRLAAFPAGLPLVVNSLPGWMLVRGLSDASGVHWTGIQRFP